MEQIAIFSEGTRFTKAKHEVSLKVAREKGLPELKHHLLPRPKGFTLVASQLAGKIDYVYDLSIGMQKVEGGHYPKITDLKNGVKVDSQIYVRRIPMSSIPVNDEKQCADFLYKIYQKKVKKYLTRFEKSIQNNIYLIYTRTKLWTFTREREASIRSTKVSKDTLSKQTNTI